MQKKRNEMEERYRNVFQVDKTWAQTMHVCLESYLLKRKKKYKHLHIKLEIGELLKYPLCNLLFLYFYSIKLSFSSEFEMKPACIYDLSKQWPLAGEFVEFEYSPKIRQFGECEYSPKCSFLENGSDSIHSPTFAKPCRADSPDSPTFAEPCCADSPNSPTFAKPLTDIRRRHSDSHSHSHSTHSHE